jgi:hypothetical protein
MISPGSKNWINKYFDLVKKGEIDLRLDSFNKMETQDLHAEFFKTGIIFGFPGNMLFSEQVDRSSWTMDEQLSVLLLESLLKIYIAEKHEWNEQDFLDTILKFYSEYKESNSFNLFSFFSKETSEIKLENILKERIHIKRRWTNILWVSYLNNSLVFLDVIAYKNFLSRGMFLKGEYKDFAHSAISTIILAAYSDGKIDPQESSIFDVFLSAANVSRAYVNHVKTEGKNLSINNIEIPEEDCELFRYYLLDLAILTVFSDLIAEEEEKYFLQSLCKYLSIGREHFNESIVLIESFVLENNHRITFLKEMTSYDRLYASFSKRWIKVLGRNKDKLVEELKNNKELLALVNKSMSKELNDVEKSKVKTHFRELIKSMPALAIFMLPGGALLLPVITKIIPELLPNSFRSNQINDEEHPIE